MPRHPRAIKWRLFSILVALLLIPQSFVGATSPGVPSTPVPSGSDAPILNPGAERLEPDEEQEERLEELDAAILSKRLAGDKPLSVDQAAALNVAAARQAQLIRKQGLSLPSGPATFNLPWSAIGPNPINEVTRSTPIIEAMNGRIGALLIHPDGYFILGGAQGGIWTFDGFSWTPHTDNLPSLAIGALAMAPSDSDIVYAGTGEGALSGDSYFGNGILKSTDGGITWSHVSGDYFVGVSISRLVVDPNDPSHLYVSVLRGRGGARRTSPTLHSKFGIWESNNGGTSWTLILGTPKNTLGATDLEMDPQDPDILYTSFWGDKIYKSTDGGGHWAAVMNGLPTLFNADNLTRWSIGLSHPSGEDPVLYVGSDIIDDNGDFQPSHLWRSDDEAASWQELPTTGFNGSDDSVDDYCGGQCFYDNVVEVDPSNTDVVYAAGQFNYGIGSGGAFRSDDGGQTWKNLGWDQHPDYHAFAFGTDPDEVLIGSDGGVWWSPDRGGRMPGSGDEALLTGADWVTVNAFGLQIAQFTSIATNPNRPPRVWGGTQDNGTMRKATATNDWFDMYGGDGGQVLVDPTDFNYVYGTFFGISPYRATDGGGAFFTNQFIRNGLNLSDRSDFYIPWVMNKENPNQLFLGTYRLYRTDNAKAASAGDVLWKPISPDLTGGCNGTAPNGARTCALSAIGVGGGNAVYAGSLDGFLWLSTDAEVNNSPTWTRLDQNGLPKRPVSQIAVDRSNYRIAYVAYNGFSMATPGRPGHVYKTTNAGTTWTDVSGNLPDTPVNSVILDPSFPNTLYVGTDVGPFVTYDGGAHWNALGTGFPIVSIWQLDLDTGMPTGGSFGATHARTLVAGTHGRGAFRISDGIASSALMISKVDAGVPVGPASNVEYTLTVRNIGNAAATGITVVDPVPANTSFVSAADGGSFAAGKVTWSGISLAAGASVNLHFTVTIAPALKKGDKAIVNDGIVVTSAEGPGTTGSPTVTPIAPSYGVSISPASQTDGARAGDSAAYPFTVKNLGFNSDTFALSSSGGTYTVSLFQADCTTASTSTGSLAAGATYSGCAKVDVPGGAANGDVNIATLTATSAGNPAATASGTVKTIAVTFNVLLVDEDGNGPNVQSYYTAALTGAGVSFNTWDLSVDPNIPLGYMEAHGAIVWFTGNAYPGPLLPYEARLTAYLNAGGHLFVSGHDILDQSAGTTTFVHDFLHINWDGSETQNDKSTNNVHAVAATLTDGVGTVPISHAVLGAAFEDRITPIGPAIGIFSDDSTAYDALSVDTGTYKVVFLAFPFEAYGDATQKIDLMSRILTYFGP